MSLVTTEEVETLVPTDLSTEQLQAVIDREETSLNLRFGLPSLTELGVAQELTQEWILNPSRVSVFADRRIATAVSLTVSGDNYVNTTSLTSGTNYVIDEEEGRLDRVSNGVPINWERYVRFIYTPEDDNDVRQGVIIDLVRLTVERQGFARESVAGEYSYTSPANWEDARESVMSRLKPFVIIG